MRLLTLLMTARSRIAMAGIIGTIGLGRLGVFAPGPGTTLPGELYGALLLFLATALLLTCGAWRWHWAGRISAGLSACVLAGLALDFWLTVHGVTTALILVWLALWLIAETVAEHDC